MNLDSFVAKILLDLNQKNFWDLSLAEKLDLCQDRSFQKQLGFVLDQNRFVAALCTRRAGKSNGLAYRFKRTMFKYPSSFCPFVALTRESAKNILWPILKEQDDKFKIGARFTEHNLTMTLPNESRLQLFGADSEKFINRLKGIKTPGAAVDEAQDFGTHLEKLIDDVLTPTIVDYPDGWIALTGTPGPVPVGLFYEITALRKFNYSVHQWSLFDNPYLPDARAFVSQRKKDKAWTDTNPTYLREWCAEWVLDLDALVFKYSRERNHYDQLPSKDGWEYVMGVDLGFHDSDAISILGFHESLKEVYLIEEEIHSGQAISELAAQIGRLVKRYNPYKIVMDTGGLGKKVAEEITRRYDISIHAAEKTRKFEYIELLNDAMRTRTFFARSESQFAKDCAKVKWDSDTSSQVLKISDHFHSDITDSVLYAFRECLHWLYEEPRRKTKPGSSEWFESEVTRMEEAALALVKKSEDLYDPFSQEWE